MTKETYWNTWQNKVIPETILLYMETGNGKWRFEIRYEYMVDNALKQAYYIGKREIFSESCIIILSVEGHSIILGGLHIDNWSMQGQEECDTDEKTRR